MTREKRQRRFTAPWSPDGWYGEQQRADRDPELYEIIRQAGRGRVNPLGFQADAPALVLTPATHNPYLALPLVAIFVLAGIFLFGKLQDSAPIIATVTALFFILGGAFILFMNVRRIPAWHRARRAVKLHIEKHGGRFPKELRWFT